MLDSISNIYRVILSYFIDKDVCYLTMCDQSFSKRTTFSYLEEIANQFYAEYGTKINTVARPYSFIEFGKKKRSKFKEI